MTVDIALVQLALVFLPGIVWASVHRRFGARTEVSNFDFLLQIFVFGVIAYAVSFVAYATLGASHPLSAALDDVAEATSVVLPPVDVLISVAIAAGLGVAFLYVENYKLLTRLLQGIRATRTFGDEDVWDFTFNSALPNFEYAQIRDFERRLTFSGWVLTYSASGETRELVLERAQVHDFEGKLLYDMPYIYLSRPVEDVHVEFPYRDASQTQES